MYSASLRSCFRIDSSTCYLDAASITPRPAQAAEAGRHAVSRTEQPWLHRGWDKAALAGRVRGLAAAAIGAVADDMAIVCAVSYGMATAAANLSIPARSRILLLEDDHPSAALVWRRAAAASGATLDVVARPADANWTIAVLERIEAHGNPISVAVLPPLHWTDGTNLDLARLAPELRARGSALVIDATQAVGVEHIDVHALDADFVTFPAYKWMLGPYGTAFLYAHPRHQQGISLEEHMNTRKAPALKRAGSSGDFSFLRGAQRFDRGERDDGLALSLAEEGLALSMSVAPAKKREYLWHLNNRLTAALAQMPVTFAASSVRSPHILGIHVEGRDVVEIAEALERQGVFVSPRRGYLRISPYMYNDEADIDTFVSALGSILH